MIDKTTALEQASLWDTSDLPTWLLKGHGAESWLASRVTNVPANIYDTTLVDGGARLIRTGADEFLIESTSGVQHSLHQELLTDGDLPNDFLAFERGDAIFCLTGASARMVLAQTCGISWDDVKSDTLVMTRVAGVSCAIRPTSIGNLAGYVIRVDPTYAVYLWEQLLIICEELGGGVVERSVVLP
jgi:glycine cleavage system aminomethyltransferase T